MTVKKAKQTTGSTNETAPSDTGNTVDIPSLVNSSFADAIAKITELRIEVKKQNEELNGSLVGIKDKIKAQEGILEEHEENIRSTELRGVQIIGTFSGVIALVLVFVSETQHTRPLFDSVLILATGALVLILFAVLVNVLLESGKKDKNVGKIIVLSLLSIVSVIGIVCSLLIAKHSPSSESSNQEREMMPNEGAKTTE